MSAALPSAQVCAIAVRASTCERSVRKVLAGLPLAPLPRSRIEAVLRQYGIPIPPVRRKTVQPVRAVPPPDPGGP